MAVYKPVKPNHESVSPDMPSYHPPHRQTAQLVTSDHPPEGAAPPPVPGGGTEVDTRASVTPLPLQDQFRISGCQVNFNWCHPTQIE